MKRAGDDVRSDSDARSVGAAAKRMCIEGIRVTKRKLEDAEWTRLDGGGSSSSRCSSPLRSEAKRRALSDPQFERGLAMGYDRGKRDGNKEGEDRACAEIEASLPGKLEEYCTVVAGALRIGYDNQLRAIVDELTSGRAPMTFVY